jgi:transcriptional regulator with XRE-family HTH domain
MLLMRRKDAAGPVMRQFRQSLALSQQQMAEICGVTQQNVAHWESGRHPMGENAIQRLFAWVAERGVKQLEEGPPPAALLKLRVQLGWTPAAMAAKLNLKEPVVRRAEIGNMPISMEMAARYRELAAEHGLDFDRLAAA